MTINDVNIYCVSFVERDTQQMDEKKKQHEMKKRKKDVSTDGKQEEIEE